MGDFLRSGGGPQVFSHVFPHVRANVLVPTAAGTPYDPEASSYFTAAGITDVAAQELFNTYFLGIKSYFGVTLITEVFDQLVVTANQDTTAMITDLCGRINATAVNDPVLAQWEKVTGGGGTKYINTNFNETTSAVRYTTNNRAFFHRMSNYTPSGVALTMGLVEGATERYMAPSVGANSNFPDFPSAFRQPNLAGVYTGLITHSRTASNHFEVMQGSVSHGVNTSAGPALVNRPHIVMGYNNNGTPAASGGTVGLQLFGFSRGLSLADNTAFDALNDTLLTGLAAL